ncbi:MAG: hypothetical protein HN352_07795 [Bacteroidetes bacterium]|jgi:hypothetical protein|nr:hypothetical protein [Bacteroidota bacterium]MBT3750697.1 hypothetical protein [Bacteroidota bacterium]MBT4398833.1 hypothetical protein [Bacteroidota bacterium]MBT4408441.1 hypothetical protein [Bacteroidota bacterium]MBT5428238.1 hypothetical protein [Bacteroidota bacterium]
MKQSIHLIGLVLLFTVFSLPTGNVQALCLSNGEKGCNYLYDNLDSKEIQVLYFHATGRCVTCKAVEAVTKSALKEYYGKKIPFTTINREKNKKNPLLKKYKITGQTLLIVSGDEVVNITTEAFLNARKKPEKLKSTLKSTIDKMLK